MSLARKLFSRQWLLATLLALIAVGVMVRLGFWQLDRLAVRREFNARATAWVDGPELTLQGAALAEDLYNMEYRPVRVRGEYLFEAQVALRNQQLGTQLGVTLLTPLRIEGSDALVLVARGWIPQADAGREAWPAYDQPGVQEVVGVLRRSRAEADFGPLLNPTLMPGEDRLLEWVSVNVERMAAEGGLPMLTDVYVQALPAGDRPGAGEPIPLALDLEISEGSHAGYAGQWFTFATILLLGYPFYVSRAEPRETE